MNSERRSAFLDFKENVASLAYLLDLVDAFKNFASKVAHEGAREISEEESDLRDKAALARVHLPKISGSLIPFACGFFEYYICQLIEGVAEEESSKAHRYSDLPGPIRKHIRAQTLQIALNPGKYRRDEIQADAMLIALADNLKVSEEIDSSMGIMSEIISITESNMKNDVLADLFKRVGIRNVWSDVGKQAKLKMLLEMSNDKDCEAEAKSRLDELMNIRNKLVHSGPVSSYPSTDDVRFHCDFLVCLGEILLDITCMPRTW